MENGWSGVTEGESSPAESSSSGLDQQGLESFTRDPVGASSSTTRSAKPSSSGETEEGTGRLNRHITVDRDPGCGFTQCGQCHQCEQVAKSANIAGAKKADIGKPAFHLIPARALEQVAEVFEFGGRKYGPWNHRKGFKRTRLMGSALRHCFAWLYGENEDDQSGRNHLSHAICQLLMLLDHEVHNLGEDDRWTKT